jgi:hypothetical protein
MWGESTEDDGQDDPETTTEDENASEHGSNSSYISDPRDSDDDSEAAYDRYLQRQQRQEDRYLAKEIEKQEESDRQKEAEVQKAYTALDEATRTGERIPIGPLRDEGFWDLYSSEYHSHYFEEVNLWKRISFGNIYDDIPGFTACGPGEIAAELHIYPEAHLDFEPFTKPAYASLEPVTIQAVQGAEVDVTFLGNGYLKLRVDLDVLLGKGKPMGARAESSDYRKNSGTVEFVGIWKSIEQWKRERDEWRRPTEPPSPKDSMAARMNNYWQ